MERGAMATKGTGARRLVTLHGLSALQYWSFARCSCKSREQLLGTAKTRWADTKLALESASVKPPARLHDAPPECTAPLHVMITDKRARTESASVVTHLRTAALPPSSLVRIGPEYAAASPELAFAQAAKQLGLTRLVMLGFELCGTYSSFGQEETSYQAIPLTNVARISGFIEKSASFQGKQAAQRAIRHVIDGSASPRETQLAMMLSLPYRHGGYGFPAPKLNYVVDLPKHLGARKRYVLDLYWPELKLDVEYDSNAFHAHEEKMLLDSRRRAALEAMGITSVNVASEQVRNSGAFNELAKQLAALANHRLRYKDPDFTKAHLQLRHDLGI